MRPQAAILALVLVSAPVAAADTAASAPKAVAVETSHDFGKVTPSEVLHHTFEIRNEGSTPLDIVKVETDCKCTATDYDAQVPPGGVGKVNAAVDTRVLNGVVQGVLRVRTNDPENPVLQLKTLIDVEPVLGAKPGYARWNMVQGEKEGTISQTIWSIDGADFHVLRVEAPPGLRISFRPARADELKPEAKGAQWRVEATVDSWAPVGPIVGYLEVTTDHPAQHGMRIPISGFVRPVIHVTPAAGDFGDITLDKERKAVFFLQNFATEKIAIVKAVTTVKGTQLKVVPVEDGRSYNLELILPAAMPMGAFKGALRIETDNKKAPLVEIPVSGRVTKPSGDGATAGG
jgi:hypothetical protein